MMSGQRTYDWNGQTHTIRFPDLPDEEIARQVRMLLRNDLNHEGIVCSARDRIMALVKEKTALQADRAKLVEACQALPTFDIDNPDAADFKDNAEKFIRAMRLARAALAEAGEGM